MDLRIEERINPEMDCIFLLERRFHQPERKSIHSLDDLQTAVSDKFNVPVGELQPLLRPLVEAEQYVLSNLSTNPKRLAFYFAPREMSNSSESSLGRPLYHAMQSGIRFSELGERERIRALMPTYVQLLNDFDLRQVEETASYEALLQLLLSHNCDENIKWVCTILYHSIDAFIEELRGILKEASALLRKSLPDMRKQCADVAVYAREFLGPNPFRLFKGLQVVNELPEQITVVPCMMEPMGAYLDFADATIYLGVYYQQYHQMIQRYSNQTTSLVGRMKVLGDKTRLEIIKTLKSGGCNGQDLSESLGLAPTTISYHTNQLCNAGMLNATKRGTSIYYEIQQEGLRQFVQEMEHYLL